MRARNALHSNQLPITDAPQPSQRWQVARGGMRALQEMSRLSAARLEPAALCQQVLLLLAKLYGYDLLSIYFYAPVQEAPATVFTPGQTEPSEPVMGLRLVAQIGYNQVLERIPLTAGVAGRVARTHKTEYIRNVRHDPDFVAAVPGISSEICVPLITPDLSLAPTDQTASETCAVYRGPHTDILTHHPEASAPGRQGRASDQREREWPNPAAARERPTGARVREPSSRKGRSPQGRPSGPSQRDGGQFLGTLIVESFHRALAPSDVRLLEAVASQLAIALENARLQQQAGERDTIVAIAERINAPFDLDEVLHEALRQIIETLGVSGGSIHLLENAADGSTHMQLRAIWGGSAEAAQAAHLDYFQVAPGVSPVYSVLSTGSILLINDLQAASIPRQAAKEYLLNAGIRSLLCLPLENQGQYKGQLTIASLEPGYFSSERINFLRIISRQISAAIQKAQLLADLRTAYERQREVDRLKDEFMLTTSHELRTPLTTVQGYLNLLSDFGGAISPDLARQFLASACQACDQLTVLVSSITNAVQLDVQMQQIQPQPIQLSSAIKTVLSLLEPQIYQEKRALTLEIQPALWVRADEVRLREVLLNLLSNALKYSAPGQPLVVQAELAADGYAKVQVIDAGPGLRLEEQARLFQRFVRLERAINSAERGSGLGLYISRRLIEAMGGRIWVESSGIPGEGTAFSFTLPLTTEPKQQT